MKLSVDDLVCAYTNPVTFFYPDYELLMIHPLSKYKVHLKRSCVHVRGGSTMVRLSSNEPPFVPYLLPASMIVSDSAADLTTINNA